MFSTLTENEQTTQSIAKFYESDVDLSMLNTELAQTRLLHSNNVKSPDDLHAQFRSNNELPLIFPNLATLLRIFLTLPCTTCEAERSFSVVRTHQNIFEKHNDPTSAQSLLPAQCPF